jgi:hypothetical protein
MSVAALRQQLALLVAPPRAGTAAIPTGLAVLDRALSGGGLPCGRLTEILGGRGTGRTTLTRQLVAGAIAAGRWVAYVDGTRTLWPRDWTAMAGTRRLWIIRPPNDNRVAWCADVLLRSGAFGLVVLDGGPPLPRPVALRLTRLASDHDTAVVIVGDERAIVGSAVRLRVHRRRADLAVIRIVVEKGGTHQSVEVCCAIDVARRLCAHPEVPDRRGVAARNRWGTRIESSPEARGQSPEERRIGDRRFAPDVRHRASSLVVRGGCRR